MDLLATAPGGVARLRELILTLAVQGKLVPQDPADEPASVLLKKIRAEKDRLIAEGKIKRDKPLAPITYDETPFEVPAGWEWVRLAEVALPQAGFAFKSSGFNDARQGLPLIRIRDVGDNDPSTFFSGDYREEFTVQSGDWLISMDGEFRVREWLGPKALLNQRVTRLMFYGDELFQPFVTAALQFKLSELQGTKAYTTVDHLSGGQIASSVIALPPFAEQSRIVSRVEGLMRLCDALEAKSQLEAAQHAQLVTTLLATLTDSATPEAVAESWQRIATHVDLLLDRPEAVDALEQTLLQLAVRGLLTNRHYYEPSDVQSNSTMKGKDCGPFLLPKGWRWRRLGDLADLINGDRGQNYPNRAEYVSKGVPFINTGHIDPDGSLSSDRMNFLTREKFNSLRSGKVRKGDLVYCLRGATLGKTAVVEYDEGAIASSLVIVRPSAELDKKFAYLYLTSPTGRAFIQQHDNGSAQPNLAAGSLKKYWVPLPPLAEQSRIVARVEALHRLCADLRQRLSSSQTTQAKLAEVLVESQAAAA
jgi:type I restriction enzyme S subunit